MRATNKPTLPTRRFHRRTAAMATMCLSHDSVARQVLRAKPRGLVLGLGARLCGRASGVLIGTDRDRKTGAVRALLARADAQGLAYAGRLSLRCLAKKETS